MLFVIVVLLASIIGSVRVQHRYSLGDKFTYSENQTKTTINLFTGEKTVEQKETIYTEIVIELDDPLTNATAEVEKTYSFVRFTPPDERASRRLLTQRTRELLTTIVMPLSNEYSVGKLWTDTVYGGIEGKLMITRIYKSDEYKTKVIDFDIDAAGTISALGYKMPIHYLETKGIDIETGLLLFQESIHRHTIHDKRNTDITVIKLIKRETHTDEL